LRIRTIGARGTEIGPRACNSYRRDYLSMQIPNTLKVRSLTISFVTGVLFASLALANEANQDSEISAPRESPDDLQSTAKADEIFADLVKHNELRNAELQKYSATRTYAVTDLGGKVHAKETVLMEFVAPDKKTFVAVSEEGSSVIRHMVLNRLMESEVSAATRQEQHESSITPANYMFRVLGQEDLGAHHCFVVEAIPKRKDRYLFEGKVWIDSREFAVVKIAGHPARKLSFWITRAEFVRQYDKVGGFWLPAKDETFVDVKLYGKKVLSIEHHINSVNGVTTEALVGQNPGSETLWKSSASN
jgi:hypothetical protein